MSRKREHSVSGRQYAKRKKAAEKQEGPAKKSKQKKNIQQDQLKSGARSLQSQAKTLQIAQSYQMYPGCALGGMKKRSHNDNGMLTWNCPLHHDRIPDHENHTTADET